MAEVTEEALAMVIEDLNRHKAARSDGLSNNLYKNAAGIMIHILTDLSDIVLRWKHRPESFLKAVIIPLR
ncbi:hypothetical protein PI125_g19530 [Phytophthora idaei]|nr:hypothetical protein PI125_g19530 [Phytophthora idaei]